MVWGKSPKPLAIPHIGGRAKPAIRSDDYELDLRREITAGNGRSRKKASAYQASQKRLGKRGEEGVGQVISVLT